jgi:large subunit ribosomal protein L7/L12
MSTTIDMATVVEYIKGLSLLQASELVKTLEKELGVSAAAPVAMTAAPAAGGAAPAAAAEEKTEFTVVLASAPADKKIAVIKEVRAITNLGLKEAKDLVEGAPKNVLEGVNKEKAAEAKAKLEAAGATVTLK